jgi:hypothetical protein
MLKKTLKISATILIILVLALGAYYFLIGSNEAVTSGKKPLFGNFFPFGNNSALIETPFSTTTITENSNTLGLWDQNVRLISKEPVAGYVFISQTAGDMVRYIEKATGHVYDVSTYDQSTARVSNTTIPQLYHVDFTENGTGFIAQYISEKNNVETMYGKITPANVDKQVEGTLLPKQITSIAVAPNTNTIFTLEKTKQGSEGYISSPNGSNKKKIWSSPLSEFSSVFISDTKIGLSSKPSVDSQGIMFGVDTTNASVSTVISRIPRMTSLPAVNRPYVLVSGNTSFSIYNTQTGSSTALTPKTVSEKCVWDINNIILYCAVPKVAPNSASLEMWYKGLVTFSDDIWQYNILANTSRQISNLENETGTIIDISDITINKKGSILLIRNKLNDSLWSVKINQ